MGKTSSSDGPDGSTGDKDQNDPSHATRHHQQCAIEDVKDNPKGLHVRLYKNYQQAHRARYWWDTITTNATWYRVKYRSGRFGKECETPCWTTFFGGREEYSPYEPVPGWLQPLVDEVSADLDMGSRPFNAMLLRLYFDGNDEIAWHTDGRTFLGQTPTIASLSFGANATFSMRRMTNVWPPLDGLAGDGIDRSTPQRDFVVGDGDMLVMLGATQKHWHHRVPKERGRRPRLNINFRYIMSGPDAERGQKTYYKYMVHGDEDIPRSYSYKEIMQMRGGMMNFARPKSACVPSGGDNRKEDKTHQDLAATSPGNESSKPAKGEEPNIASYLAAENVDRSSFMALPEDIRRELVDHWSSRQSSSETQTLIRPTENTASSMQSCGKKRQQNLIGGRSSVGTACKGNKAMKKASGSGTLDSFFLSKKKHK